MNIFTETLPFIPPEQLFFAFRDRKYFVWLDTTLKNRENRYSVIAFEPFLIFTSKRNKTVIESREGKRVFSGDPLKYLDEILRKYYVPHKDFFCPGAFGYFGYDLGKQIEKLPDIATDDIDMPDICLGFYDTVFVSDVRDNRLFMVSSNIRQEKELDFKTSLAEKRKYIKSISKIPLQIKNETMELKHISFNISHTQYIRAIEKIKHYIASGDVSQINFAQRLEAEGFFPPETVYTRIRDVNPTSFSGYFNTGDFCLLSNSPELFLKKQGAMVLTKPMKGTRPRGRTQDEDKRYNRELSTSLKDKTELSIVVDVEKSDLNKVCKSGSVKVVRLRQIERYKTVFQATSLIEGQIMKDKGFVDLLKAAFPCGSITGFPKGRVMEIIEELEPHKRAFYTGSMGYIGFNGNAELNILIRTILLKKNKLYYSVGGGIVSDSSPDEEYEETLTKARALFLTLGNNCEKLLYT